MYVHTYNSSKYESMLFTVEYFFKFSWDEGTYRILTIKGQMAQYAQEISSIILKSWVMLLPAHGAKTLKILCTSIKCAPVVHWRSCSSFYWSCEGFPPSISQSPSLHNFHITLFAKLNVERKQDCCQFQRSAFYYLHILLSTPPLPAFGTMNF